MVAELQGIGIELKGRTAGQLKTKCPKCFNGKSSNLSDLSVNIDTGSYHCHNPGCGFEGNATSTKPKKTYNRPVWQNNTNLPDKVVNWFKDERGISQQTLMKMKITSGPAWMPQLEKNVNTVQFNYFRGEELINIKHRDRQKNFKLESKAELIFYNLNALKGAKEIIITEGEIDTLAYVEAGVENVISVPNGANIKGEVKLEYLDNCWEHFDGLEQIYIATDNDEAGIKLRNELARRLGIERCFFIDYNGRKDANDVLINEGAITLADYKSMAHPFPMEGIIFAHQIIDDVNDFYNNGLSKGKPLGIKEIDEHITFDDGGSFTVITGIPNQGKSEVLDLFATILNIKYGWKFGVFSPENFPLKFHVSKFAEKIIGRPFIGDNKMRPEDKDAAINHINENFFFIRPDNENFSLDTILEKARILVLKYGIKCLIIDPYNRLEHQIEKWESETLYISKQLDKITLFRQKYGLHIFLVAHPMKMKKKKNSMAYEVPTLYDINGSANFFNKADVGFTVYRNFETNKTEIYFQKIKFKHWGKIGYVPDINWNPFNGRYYIHKRNDQSWLKGVPYDGPEEENMVIINNESQTNDNIGF